MKIKSIIRKNIKWLLWTIVSIVLFQIMNTLFIHDWRVKRSYERVEKDISKNFYDHQLEFQELINFALNLPSINTIELLEEDKFSCYLTNYSHIENEGDELSYMISSWNEDNEDFTKSDFIINEDSTITFLYLDTMINAKYWSWDFQGSIEHDEIDKFCKYTNYTKEQLQKLMELVKIVACEAIRITDNTVNLRFNGISLYNLEYVITKEDSEIPENYKQLDKNVYYGLYDSGMFCGTMIFSK